MCFCNCAWLDICEMDSLVLVHGETTSQGEDKFGATAKILNTKVARQAHTGQMFPTFGSFQPHPLFFGLISLHHRDPKKAEVQWHTLVSVAYVVSM